MYESNKDAKPPDVDEIGKKHAQETLSLWMAIGQTGNKIIKKDDPSGN